MKQPLCVKGSVCKSFSIQKILYVEASAFFYVSKQGMSRARNTRSEMSRIRGQKREETEETSRQRGFKKKLSRERAALGAEMSSGKSEKGETSEQDVKRKRC